MRVLDVDLSVGLSLRRIYRRSENVTFIVFLVHDDVTGTPLVESRDQQAARDQYLKIAQELRQRIK